MLVVFAGPLGAVVENVRAATLAELTRVGLAGFTIDGVARAAGVNRTTIYRRWPTREALLASAVEPLLERYDADPATGSLSGDLLALMLTIRDAAQTPEGRALAEAVIAGSNELRDLVGAVLDRVLAPFKRALDQAEARGDRHRPADADALVHLIFSGVVLWE